MSLIKCNNKRVINLIKKVTKMSKVDKKAQEEQII